MKTSALSLLAATATVALVSGCANMTETQQTTAKGAGMGAVAGAVVVQVLVGVLAARRGHHARAADVAVDQEGDLVGIRSERFEDEISAGAHFIMVVGGDVGREQLGLAGFVIWKRFKGEGGVGRVLSLFYWYLPAPFGFFRSLPDSGVGMWRG